MKYPKTKIKESAEEVQKFLRKVSRVATQLSEMANDAREIEAEIEKIGSPSYKDEAAITRVTGLKLKLQLCQSETESFAEKEGDLYEGCREALYTPSVMAGEILNEIVQRRAETIACSLQPFCRTKERAVDLATKTDAYQSGGRIVQHYTGLTTWLTMMRGGGGTAVHLQKAASEILAVLEEALRPVPDLMKFLPFQPDAAAQESVSVSPTPTNPN